MPEPPVTTAGRVVVGSDASPSARHAVDWAARIAAAGGQTLLLLAGEKIDPATLAVEVARVREHHPGLTVESLNTAQEAGQALVTATEDAELVVLGARGRSLPWRVRALGGVADHVMTHARGPALVVPECSAERDGPVVVGVDDSQEARAAVTAAFAVAARTGRPLRAVHVLPENLAASRAWAASGLSADALLAPTQALVEEILEPLVRQFPQVPLTTVVLWGHPTQVLVEESRSAHLVVVGSRGHGGFGGLLLGSTSRELLRRSQAPVLVLRRGLSAADPLPGAVDGS